MGILLPTHSVGSDTMFELLTGLVEMKLKVEEIEKVWNGILYQLEFLLYIYMWDTYDIYTTFKTTFSYNQLQ